MCCPRSSAGQSMRLLSARSGVRIPPRTPSSIEKPLYKGFFSLYLLSSSCLKQVYILYHKSDVSGIFYFCSVRQRRSFLINSSDGISISHCTHFTNILCIPPTLNANKYGSGRISSCNASWACTC